MPLDLVDAVLASGATLPSPGTVLPRLQAAGSDEHSGLHDYARTVATDPAICAALMRVANSPVINPGRRADNLDQAIAVLGFSRTLAVTASITLHSQRALLDPTLRHAVDAIFAAAEQCAGYAHRAAVAAKLRPLADAAYLASLMQDSGLIVLARRDGHFTPPATDGSDGHPAFSAALLRNWKMPADVVAAVALQHAPREAARAEARIAQLTCLLAAGRLMRAASEAAAGEDWAAWAPLVAERLALDAPALLALRNESD